MTLELATLIAARRQELARGYAELKAAEAKRDEYLLNYAKNFCRLALGVDRIEVKGDVLHLDTSPPLYIRMQFFEYTGALRLLGSLYNDPPNICCDMACLYPLDPKAPLIIPTEQLDEFRRNVLDAVLWHDDAPFMRMVQDEEDEEDEEAAPPYFAYDEDGNLVLDENGAPVVVTDELRWGTDPEPEA